MVDFYVEREMERSDKEGRTPLLLAAYGGHCESCGFLLKLTRAKNCTDNHDQNALHLAAESQRLDKVLGEMLVEAGVRLDARDDTGMTPLLLAARCGSISGTSVLLELGADPYVSNKKGHTMHHIAAGFNFYDWMLQFSAPTPIASMLQVRIIQLKEKIIELQKDFKKTKCRDERIKKRSCHPGIRNCLRAICCN